MNNALLLGEGLVVPLYGVTHNDGVTAVGYASDGRTVRAFDQGGSLLWQNADAYGQMFGGFDFDQDGWPDLGLVRSERTDQTCGSEYLVRTWIDFVAGRTGRLYLGTVPLVATCWTFPGVEPYQKPQWSVLSVVFGARPGIFAVQPHYAQAGWLFRFVDGRFVTTGSYLYPSTPSYGATYDKARENAYHQGEAHIVNSDTANGLMTRVGGEERLAFFTSARVAQFRTDGSVEHDQLVLDTPYLNGGREDLAGRNKGEVAIDPQDPKTLVLAAGTTTNTVFQDMRSGRMATDQWGGIERHVTRYDLVSGSVEQRFFSYAHDANDGFRYERRLVYPNTMLVPSPAGKSRQVFNLYQNGHWNIHVTKPGSTEDEVVFRDLFVWDIRDFGSGEGLWLVSPCRDESDPDVPGYYFPKWRTETHQWQESTHRLDRRQVIEGSIPFLAPTFREATRTTYKDFLYPALTAKGAAGPELLSWTKDGRIVRVPLSLPR